MRRNRHFCLVTALALLTLVQADAQSKMGLSSRLLLQREQQLKSSTPALQPMQQMPSPQFHQGNRRLVLIDTQADNAREQLTQAGVEVLRMRGNIAICSVSADSLSQIAGLACVKHIEFGHRRLVKMDRARQHTGIEYIQQGNELPQAYTGKGVVTGIIDAGFDPNHVNFLNADGTTRFGYMSRIYATSGNAQGYVYENYYPKKDLPILDNDGNALEHCYAIEDFTTDNKQEYHGSHTLGAMAGGYRGTIQAALLDEQGNVSLQTIDNPYYGGATGSEIVASCGDLYDEFILFGIEDIISYAQYSNGCDDQGNALARKPCVINLSLGSNIGAHDPHSLMNQYLGLLGQEAIICLVAGNEGNLPIVLQHEFSDEAPELKSFVVPQEAYAGAYTEDGVNYYHNIRVGTVYFYADDSTPLDIQAVVYNEKRNSIAMRMAVGTESSGTVKSWASGSEFDAYGNAVTTNSTFNKAFEGYVAMAGAIDDETGRYMAIIDYYLYDNQETNADSNYKLGLLVNGQAGQYVSAYGDGLCTQFSSLGLEGWTDGSRDGTINDMACADNVLTVGAYNTRSNWASLDGDAYGYGEEKLPEGDITFFSSFGTMRDGHTLPHVCAPGACIISSVNAFCVENPQMGYNDSGLQARCTANDRNYYWQQELGTSMACPVVAGGIALWLEADPTLTIDDVKEIITATAVRDEQVQQGIPAQWGAGKFDAYAGLKEVLRRQAQGIEAIQGNMPVAGLYSLSGQLVRTIDYGVNDSHLDTAGLSQGFYTLRLQDGRTTKIYVK